MTPYEAYKSVNTRLSEGWHLGPGWARNKIMRNTADTVKFKTNEEAEDYVKKRAAEGSEYHQAIISWIALCKLTDKKSNPY